MKKRIFFTVTNDLTYDQRMQRICTTLSTNGYEICIVGRRLKSSKPLKLQPYQQKRLNCFFTKGKFFYLEYNLRLFFYLLFIKTDAICAIDLDTILPCLIVTKLKGIKRFYDAHELFTELKEVKKNPFSKKIWQKVEKISIPQFKNGYTVCKSIANEFEKRYNVKYQTIRNVPFEKQLSSIKLAEKFFIYTGAVNEGRGFEYLIPAMQFVNHKLVICGDGNFMEQALALTKKYSVEDKIIFKGMLLPHDLHIEVSKAYIGINLVENIGLNQYYSLPNKFFDYIQSGIPQISMDYPEYQNLNTKYDVALLINNLNIEQLAESMNKLMADDVLYKRLKNNCIRARKFLIWENEEKKIIDFYNLSLK